MAADIAAIINEQYPGADVTVDEIVLISGAINQVVGDRLLRKERVQLEGIGTLYLEINESTRRHIPGQGIVKIPYRYNVDFNLSKLMERKFGELPALPDTPVVGGEFLPEENVALPVDESSDKSDIFENAGPVSKNAFVGKLAAALNAPDPVLEKKKKKMAE